MESQLGEAVLSAPRRSSRPQKNLDKAVFREARLIPVAPDGGCLFVG